MPAFKEALFVSQYLPAAFSAGVLFLGVLLYASIYLHTRERLHRAMAVLGLAGFLFVMSEVMVLSAGWLVDAPLGMQFHRVEQAAAALFVYAIPLMLHHFLVMNDAWRRVNRVIIWAGLGLSVIIIIVAYAAPDLYVSQTVHRGDWLLRQADHGRGQEGPLYLARDGVLAVMILYALGSFIADMVMHGRFRYLLLSFAGILIAIYSAVVDVISVYTGEFYDFIPGSRHSRFVVGITLFILLSMGAVLRKFFDMAREVREAHELARQEAEKSTRQNDFIKNVLKSGAGGLVSFSESLSASISSYTTNTQNQAAATQEVSASVEEIAAGIEHVKNSIDEQFDGIGTLSATMEDLAAIVANMNGLVGNALRTMEQISANALSGEKSLAAMEESMSTISASSREITGIAQIINDISDRINLLSLNAAIEAARAGEYGRGFAVVADEISKLADQTASSIKNIDSLIMTNEKEIQNHTRNISAVVSKIDLIIKDIEKIVSMIGEISAEMGRQTSASDVVTEKGSIVRAKAELIMNAMNEQKAAIGEISRTIAEINELAQRNTGSSLDISESSRALVDKVEKIHRDIEDFGRDGGAQAGE